MRPDETVWVPVTVAVVFGDEVRWRHGPCHNSIGGQTDRQCVIPDSPALPAVARLLADPATVAGLVELLTGVDWHYETPEAERAGRALLAALTGDQAATVVANGGGDE